ncbi:MAG: two-component regulator propeller domain-containing protein [Draconibacterium sp.]
MNWLYKYKLTVALLCFPFALFAQPENLIKNFLTVDNGLSHNEVTAIVQDNDGFIWIGTRGGLNRYDGYGFKVFNQVPNDPNSLVNPSIESLFVDSRGHIWIGTKSGGVSKYDPVSETFKNIVSNYRQPNPLLSDNRILCFHEDTEGNIWMGTWGHGIFVYNEAAGTTVHYLDSTRISSIAETADGTVWVGAAAGISGLYEFDKSSREFVRRRKGAVQEIKYDGRENVLWMVGGNTSGLARFDLRNYKDERFWIESSESGDQRGHIYESLYVDERNGIWLGTWGTGFYRFDVKSKSFRRYLVYPDAPRAFNKDYDAILSIFEDKDQNLWLGSNGGGVCVLVPKLAFHTIGYHIEAQKGLVNTRLMSVLEDHSGRLWMGTIGSGLFWSPDRKKILPVENPLENKSRFFTIKFLYQDENDKIWVGTNVGVYVIEPGNGYPVMEAATQKYGHSLFRHNAVSFLGTDSLFLLGSLQNGLFVLDKSDTYKPLKNLRQGNSATGLQSNRISFLLNDSKNRVWVGTYNGLHIIDNTDTTVVVAEDYFNITGNFTGNIITCLDEDVEGNIWVGTPNGLNLLREISPNCFEISYFTEKEGLASNFIKGIAHGPKGNIWLSTNIGISKLVVGEAGLKVVNFNESDGVNGKNFTEASVYRNSRGEIFFGGAQGLTYFDPDHICERSTTHKPIFTCLYVLNQLTEAGKTMGRKPVIDRSISHSGEITLSYKQNNFELEFSALDFQSMGNNQYKYLLEGLDDEYNFIGNRRFINFNNLRPGEYTLKVIASNSHNVWNENPAEIKISVSPPFWQSWYALLFYLLVVIGIVTIIRWNAIKQVRLANSLEIEKLQREQDRKINEMKFQFFTNISHEFRTPLTLILAPLKELLQRRTEYRLDGEVSAKILLIRKNSERLMKLVDQLLDFRKLESGKMALSASLTDLDDFISDLCFPFKEIAKINGIDFSYSAVLETKQIWCDRDKLEIVLNNLISNAFKYVQGKGKIEVSLYEEEEEVLITVSDNGSGIKPTEIKLIFDRFYRVNQSGNKGSTGIGLDLAKRFVELHRGTITVTSEPNVNTEFIVTLPKGNEHLNPEEIVDGRPVPAKVFLNESKMGSIFQSRPKATNQSNDRILIVEDEEDVRKYLVGLLEPHYQVSWAVNGIEGFKKVRSDKPDLIVSDLVMPEMDGLEFYQKIRENEKTALIPFIFLTARNDEQFRLQAIQKGADGLISKPFDPDLLLGKVRNILSNRKELQKKYSKSIRLQPSEIEITSTEEAFIEKVISIIETNLQNSNFTSGTLASEMNMSASSLYRRLKGITDNSTAGFIRSLRIKRAAQLLADRKKTITEIAYDVGFNDVKHFRAVFQKQYNCSPSKYRDKL